MSEKKRDYHVCAIKVASNERCHFKISELYVFGANNDLSKFEPKNEQNFNKDEEYGVIDGELMSRVAILMLSARSADITKALANSGYAKPLRRSTSMAKEPLKNYAKSLEKLKSKSSKEDKQIYKEALTKSSADIMKRYDEKIHGSQVEIREEAPVAVNKYKHIKPAKSETGFNEKVNILAK